MNLKLVNKKGKISLSMILWFVIGIAVLILAVIVIGSFRAELYAVYDKILGAIKFGGIG